MRPGLRRGRGLPQRRGRGQLHPQGAGAHHLGSRGPDPTPPREGRGQHDDHRGALGAVRGPAARPTDRSADLGLGGRERGQALVRDSVALPPVPDRAARIELRQGPRRDPEVPAAQPAPLGPEPELFQDRIQWPRGRGDRHPDPVRPLVEPAERRALAGGAAQPGNPLRQPERPRGVGARRELGRGERREPDLGRAQAVDGLGHPSLDRPAHRVFQRRQRRPVEPGHVTGLRQPQTLEPRMQARAQDPLELPDEPFGLDEHVRPCLLELDERIPRHTGSLGGLEPRGLRTMMPGRRLGPTTRAPRSSRRRWTAMDQYRRYGRWLKRAAWVLAIYLFAAWLFMGLSPSQSLSQPSLVMVQLRPVMLQALILVFFILLQFLARGNDYVIYPNEYDTSFDDVRGQPAAVEATQEVLRVFEGFKDFKQMGGYPPHGILFEGPPGTGKTLMAKAIAGASGVPFLFATGSGFANMFMGIGNMKVRKLFKKGRVMSDKYGGSVIFIDEIDAVGSRGAVTTDRSGDRATDRIFMGAGTGGGGGMGVINELLVQMDGFTVPRGLWRHIRRLAFRAKPKVPFYNILVIGATNRASTLDPALVRPGRFDRKIHVGLPDAEGRQDILQYYLSKVRHEPIDYAKLSRMTVGYSPASLKNIVNEALLFALQDGRDALRWDDLWAAKLSEEIGLKQSVKYSQREKAMVAVHEGAHAVASYALEREELQIQVITIQKRESALGLVSTQEIEEMFLRTQKQLLARIQVSLAGLVAEEIWYGQTTSGPSSDLVNATRNAAAYVGVYGMGRSLISAAASGPGPYGETDPIGVVLSNDERRREIDAILNDCRDSVRNLLLKKRHVVEGVRDALLEREELVGDEIEVLMAELGEREPIEVPARLGDGQAIGPGRNGQAGGGNGQAPRRPDAPSPP